MDKNLICIICPKGCYLQVKQETDTLKVLGNACPRGEKYAIDECTNPTRTVTSIIRVSNRKETMVSVKTKDPIPKSKIFELMNIIRNTQVNAPIKIGDTICDNIFGTQLIATKEII